MTELEILQAASEIATSLIFIILYLRERARVKDVSEARIADLKEAHDDRIKDMSRWVDTMVTLVHRPLRSIPNE